MPGSRILKVSKERDAAHGLLKDRYRRWLMKATTERSG